MRKSIRKDLVLMIVLLQRGIEKIVDIDNPEWQPSREGREGPVWMSGFQREGDVDVRISGF